MQYQEIIAESDDLQQWLAPSVYHDVMYHGTDASFDRFQSSRTPDDHVPGISVTPDRHLAASFGRVIPLYVRALKPMDYRRLDAYAQERANKHDDFSAFDVAPRTLLRWLKQDGYDAIDYTADPMLGYGIRVFDASQIRKR